MLAVREPFLSWLNETAASSVLADPARRNLTAAITADPDVPQRQ